MLKYIREHVEHIVLVMFTNTLTMLKRHNKTQSCKQTSANLHLQHIRSTKMNMRHTNFHGIWNIWQCMNQDPHGISHERLCHHCSHKWVSLSEVLRVLQWPSMGIFRTIYCGMSHKFVTGFKSYPLSMFVWVWASKSWKRVPNSNHQSIFLIFYYLAIFWWRQRWNCCVEAYSLLEVNAHLFD